MGIVGAGPGGMATAALAAMSGICKNIVVLDKLPEGDVGCGVSVPTEYVQWIATIAPPLKDLLDLPATGMRYDRYYAEGYEFTVDSECYYSGVERSALLLYLMKQQNNEEKTCDFVPI